MPPTRPFREYLAERGFSEEQARGMFGRRDPGLGQLHFEWVQDEDERARREGRLVEFGPHALEDLGLTVEDWLALEPGERIGVMAEWFRTQPPDWWEE